MAKLTQMWVLVSPDDRIVLWAGARRTMEQMMAEAVRGCIGASDYERMGTDRKRWELARRAGYRIAKADVIAQEDTPDAAR